MIRSKLISIPGTSFDLIRIEDGDDSRVAYEWLREQGCDCDYSPSREQTYYGDDKIVYEPILLNINGVVFNFNEEQFTIFRDSLGLTEL